jgi:hypothetical protein
LITENQSKTRSKQLKKAAVNPTIKDPKESVFEVDEVELKDLKNKALGRKKRKVQIDSYSTNSQNSHSSQIKGGG